MFQRISSCLSAFALALILAACVGPGIQAEQPMEIRHGVIGQITLVQLPSNHHMGVGAIVGGMAGLGIGSLIGAGSGRDVAMVLVPSAARSSATKSRKSTSSLSRASKSLSGWPTAC